MLDKTEKQTQTKDTSKDILERVKEILKKE